MMRCDLFEIKSLSLEEEGQTRGMVVDFGDLKRDLKSLCDYFDHSLIMEEGSLKNETLEALLSESFNIKQVSFRPTAENFARFFYKFAEKGCISAFACCGIDVLRMYRSALVSKFNGVRLWRAVCSEKAVA